jgi:hypothetical protein
MKIWKLVLALALGCGAVLAYVHFPNPLERAGTEMEPGKKPAEQSPAGDG